jgi:hypothetical protein
VKVDPFIEAEKIAGRNVDKACHLLEVSKSAYDQRRHGVSCARPACARSAGARPPCPTRGPS